ncbi:hypothetical protein BKP64_10830 [Marinobacter salinus]|uniref:Uncharacterized protein n=1 Tax=Marinobacter salinus TaxID=1874317 RepID=A0A1D9GLV8_9GAMM|nr:hypothetical protein [Marinobacter salinus]AOY88622.1 hypothetical protein BKP64_10830 [Marinobacter salinus]
MSGSETQYSQDAVSIEALQKENDLLKDQVDFFRSSAYQTALTGLVSKLVPWIGTAVCLWLVASSSVDIAGVLAGKETNAVIDFKTEMIGGLELSGEKAKEVIEAAGGYTIWQLIYSSALGWIFGIIGIMFGLKHRKLRKKAIESMSSRMEEYEQRVDPGRTSSGLDRTGDTHKRDK